MANTSKYGFNYKRHLTPNVQTPATLEVILGNSTVVTVGDAVKIDASGFLAYAGTDIGIYGILVGIVTKKGENIFKTKDSLTGSKSGDDTYTAGSDNQTVDQVKGVIIVDQMALFQAYSDTTLSQAGISLWFNGKVNNGSGVDGVTGSGSAYSAGTQQFQLIELVTTLEDGTAVTTVGLFRIGRSILLNDPTVGAS